MPRLTASQKAERVLLLLMGLRDDRIAVPLRDAGFTRADIDEGWTLLRGQTRSDFDDLPATGPVGTIDALDAWHDAWLPLVTATLVRRHPAVHQVLFGDLGGLAMIPTLAVSGLLNRWQRLTEPAVDDDPALQAAREAFPAARDVLAQRGFTAEIIEQARALMRESELSAPSDDELARAGVLSNREAGSPPRRA